MLITNCLAVVVLSNRKMLQRLLTKSGFVAEVVDNGAEALEMVQADKDNYQVIFMDNAMPHMVTTY